MRDFDALVKRHRARLCLECGKCTGVCPVTRYEKAFSPRRLVGKAITSSSPEDSLPVEPIWSCFTCGLCDLRCPSGIDFTGMMPGIRDFVRSNGHDPPFSHGGTLKSLYHLMTAAGMKQDRLSWLSGDLEVSTTTGDILLFVGCAPYFDTFFSDFGTNTLAGIKGAIKLLNAVGVTPVLSPNERCCGHDALWLGDEKTCRELADRNIEELSKAKPKTVLFHCPECYLTFKEHYPKLPFEVKHLYEFLKEWGLPELSGGKDKSTYTFQDPCRMTRHLDLPDLPREFIGKMTDVELREMAKSGKNGICCGGTCFTGCNSSTKEMQADRLRDASATGAGVLITACPKCEVHLRCASSDPGLDKELDLEILDLAGLLAGRLAK